MAYEQKPDTGTLFTNDRKAQENHPDYNGKLLISRDLLQKLAGYGEAMIEISAWVKETKAGKTIINLQCKEPYKKAESSGDYSYSDRINPEYTYTSSPPQAQEPEATPEILEPISAPPRPKPAPTAERYLEALKVKIAKVENYPDFEALYGKVRSPESWKVFETVPAIALEAGEILSRKKAELVLATEPVDLSMVISAIDVEISRLGLPSKEHCLARWNKSRAMLSEAELMIYLDELKAAEPAKIADDFF